MYSFNDTQDKAMQEILPLILYDFKKNNISIEIDKSFFLKYHNKEIITYSDVFEKEKIATTLNFYNYLLNPSVCEVFLSIFAFIKNKKPWIFSNSFLNCFFDSFDDKNVSILFYSNLIIKTLSGPSYYRKSFYEEDNEEIPNVGN